MVDLTVFKYLDRNLEKLSIDAIKDKLQRLTKGMVIECPAFDPPTFVYRARKIDETFSKERGVRYKDLIYPPVERCKLGRLNREGQPVFYCSMEKENVFYELPDLGPGDELIVSFWRTKSKMWLNNVGYTKSVFERLGASRDCPAWSNLTKPIAELSSWPEPVSREALHPKKNGRLRKAFSEYFTQQIGQSETYKYKMTVAIAELHLGNIVNSDFQFAGVLYPSMRMSGNGDNIALLPDFVDRHLEFRKSVHVRIDSRTGQTFSITNLDAAKEFGEDGHLVWLGRLPNWEVPPGRQAKVLFAPGKDDDGDYSISSDGVPCHFQVTDTSSGSLIATK